MKEKHVRRTTSSRAVALGAIAALALSGCNSSSSTTKTPTKSSGFVPPALKALDKLGTPEGSVNVLAWPGYVEDGSNDKTVDWSPASRSPPAARSTSRRSAPRTKRSS